MFLSIILQIVNKTTFLQIFIVDYLLQIDVRTKFLQLLFLTDGQGPGWSNLIDSQTSQKKSTQSGQCAGASVLCKAPNFPSLLASHECRRTFQVLNSAHKNKYPYALSRVLSKRFWTFCKRLLPFTGQNGRGLG